MHPCKQTFQGGQISAIFLLLFAARVFSADLLVYNNNDSGPGSLRQAIIDNNISAGGNFIIFSNTVAGTITLTSGELLISRHGTILGPGPGILAVNGNATNRIFHVHVTNDAAVLISGLTITNGMAVGGFPGNSGGGIWNDHSTLTLSNCVITDNSATSFGGGIYNDGRLSGSATLTVIAGTIHNNSGGGIFNDGDSSGHATLSVIASTISSNSATSGAGIYNYGDSGNAMLSVTASTISGNSATGDGGGIWNDGFSGSATTLVNACTFSGNTAFGLFGGGAIFNSAPASGSATVEIGDTILRSSTSANIVNNFPATIVSHGYNLLNDSSGSGLFNQPTDQFNTDPMLSPLADNGGPTRTHALLPGSPAIDKGKRDAIPALALNADQRGAPRPFDFASITNAVGGDGSDIGAFELAIPFLSIARASNNSVVVSWPSVYDDFVLESVSTFPASNNWSTVSNAPTVVGSRFNVTNSASAGNKFYRLKGL